MQEINIMSLLLKLLDEYQRLFGKMIFSFKKIHNDFIVTDVDQKLLELFNKKTDFVDKNLVNILKCEKALLEDAWTGKEVFLYCTLAENKNTFLFVILKPLKKDNQVYVVEGHCLPLDAKEFQYAESNIQ
jgi:hypothetical protein